MGNACATLMWINRKWMFTLKDGTAALDWGEGVAQALLSGEFVSYTADDYSHLLRDDEMSLLVSAGRVAGFNDQQAAICPWPSR